MGALVVGMWAVGRVVGPRVAELLDIQRLEPGIPVLRAFESHKEAGRLEGECRGAPWLFRRWRQGSTYAGSSLSVDVPEENISGLDVLYSIVSYSGFQSRKSS